MDGSSYIVEGRRVARNAVVDNCGIVETARWENIYIPQGQASNLVRQCHALTHMGKTSLENMLKRYFYFPNLAASASAQCITCAQNNTARHPEETRIQHTGRQPFEDLQIDFTEVRPSRGFKYPLVIVCTLSGWVKAFPTKMEKSREVHWSPPERNHPKVWIASDHWK